MAKQTRYSSPVLSELIDRLQRIQKSDSMTKEDADELLMGAVVMNMAFWRASGDSENIQDLMNMSRYRFDHVLELLSSQL